MSKRYLIITIASCVVCLGIGVLIGTGLGERNLKATGAGQEDSFALRQSTAEDFAAMDPEQLEKARIYYTVKLYVMKDRQEAAREALAEMLEYADNYSGGSMTDGLYRRLRLIYNAREESEELSSRIRGLDKIRKYQPGSIIDSVVWGSAAERLEKVLALFDEAVAFYEPIVDEIWKAIERT